VALFGLVSGCILPGDVVRQRFVADTQCAEQSVKVTGLPGNAYRAEGCGVTATYACTVGEAGLTGCMREAPPQPTGATATDAGSQAR